MFAIKLRTEIAARILLIAVILFNALAPTITVAQAAPESAVVTGSNSPTKEQESHSIPIFERPKQRTGETLPSPSTQGQGTTGGLLLTSAYY